MTYNLAQAFKNAAKPIGICVGAITFGLSNEPFSLAAEFVAGFTTKIALEAFADGLNEKVETKPESQPLAPN